MILYYLLGFDPVSRILNFSYNDVYIVKTVMSMALNKFILYIVHY